jgi:hypothetical protein
MGGAHFGTLHATMNMIGNSWETVLLVFGCLFLASAIFGALLKPEGTVLAQSLIRATGIHRPLRATLAADWGASYLPPRELYGTGIYQETIAVVAPGSLEQVIESVAQRIEARR